MGRDSGWKLETVVWLGLAVVLLLILALAFAVPVLVGLLQAQNSAQALPVPVRVVIQISSFVVTRWYLILGAGVVASIAAGLAAWGRRGRAASS